MISARDFVHLPYSADLTNAGIVFARRSLPRLYAPAGRAAHDRLRRVVATAAVQLAFRRYLAAQDVPFVVHSNMPFSDPDSYDVSLGGRRCDVRSFLISDPRQAADLAREPALALQAPALVPVDQHAIEAPRRNDLYVFAFLIGAIAASSAAVKEAWRAGRTLFLIHSMPGGWMRPRAWIPLGPLALKSDSTEPFPLELSGEDAGREFVSRRVVLQPSKRLELPAEFYSLTHVHAGSEPPSRLGIHRLNRPETHLVRPPDWRNTWIDGSDICVLGWITREEFEKRAKLIPAGSRVFQFSRTRVSNMAVAVSDLKPLFELFARVRDWKAL